MNVLALLQAAAYELGIPAPSAYNSNLQLLNLLYAVSRDLRNTRAFPQQKRTHSFATVAGTANYATPTDFYAGLLGTQFDQTENWELVGPLSDGAFNYELYGPGTSSSRFKYRVFGPTASQISGSLMFRLYPTPSSVKTISYDYITGSMFYTSGGALSTTLKEAAAADSDLPMFDDDILLTGLKAFYKKAKDTPFETDMALFDKYKEKAKTRWFGSFKGYLTGYGRGERRFYSSDGGW